MFADKILMITGGTGSFGEAVLSRFIHTDIKEIRIFSRDEKKQDDMRAKYANNKIKFFLGDVRDIDSVENCMSGVDFVFHAAALKQVPSCEFFPIEAVRTNILGTDNVLSSAKRTAVKKVVVLSTDKAVYPINAMGISKAMAEKVMISRSRNNNLSETIFCATRYGNVMASRGSVIPLFIAQLKNDKPITITDPKMTRFLMSLKDSVDLVLHAYLKGCQGDIFVQKSPASTVEDLAIALKEIFKKKNEIMIIGTRHGEKLYETLVSKEEMLRAEDLDKYYRIHSDNRDMNYDKYFIEGDKKISMTEDYTSHNTKRLNIEEIKEILMNLDYVKDALNV